MKKLILVAVFAVLAAAVFVAVKKGSFLAGKERRKGFYKIGAVAFETAPIEKLDVAAKYLQTEITHSELTSRSPVLRDLLFTKLKILTEGVDKKLLEIGQLKQPPTVELYMEKPIDNVEFGLKKAKFSLAFSNQRPTQGIVKINDKVYDRQDLPINQIHYSQVETQIFEEKLRVVGDLYTKQLLLKIAKDNNTTIQGYINKSILGLPLKDITDMEVKFFAEDKGIELAENDSALKERLRGILQERKTEKTIEEHLKTNFPGEVGKIYFYPPSLVIPTNDANAIYSEDAKNSALPTVTVFSSLKCGGCGQLADTLAEIRRDYKNQVRIGFVNFFYGDDWKDQLAAQASFCVNSQSNDAFWDFFSKLSKSKGEITEPLVVEAAKSTGINHEEFSKCFVAQTHKEDVDKQVKYATNLGVMTAPTVIFGARVLTGTNIKRQLENAIEDGLAQ